MCRWSWLILVAGLAGCTSIQVSYDYDTQADFSALHSYDWLPAPELGSDDPRIKFDTLLGARIQKAVDEQLALKGFVRNSEQPDFLVTYNVAIDQKVSVTYLNELYGYRRGGGFGSRHDFRYRDYPGPGRLETEYDQGSLILDVVRSEDKQLIWRGSASAEVDPGRSPEQKEKRLGKAVQMIFESFPPPK